MANPVLMTLDRHARRRLLQSEGVRRKTGKWGSWERITFPQGSVGSGWSADFMIAHRNGVFSVLDRTLRDGTRHLAVSSLSGDRPTWWEMQRIKTELAGAEATGVEVYPPDDEVVDEADMFHLWIMPKALPFTLAADPARATATGVDGGGGGNG